MQLCGTLFFIDVITATCAISILYFLVKISDINRTNKNSKMTLIQEKTAPDYLGRVLSVFTMLGSLAMPFGMLFFGPLADIINLNYILIGTGVLMMFLGILYFVSKTLKNGG